MSVPVYEDNKKPSTFVDGVDTDGASAIESFTALIHEGKLLDNVICDNSLTMI